MSKKYDFGKFVPKEEKPPEVEPSKEEKKKKPKQKREDKIKMDEEIPTITPLGNVYITSDKIRTIYYLLTRRSHRGTVKNIAKEIIGILRQVEAPF